MPATSGVSTAAANHWMSDRSRASEDPKGGAMLKRAAIVIILFALLGAAVNFPLAMWCDKSRMQWTGVKQTMNIFGADAAKRAWPERSPHPLPWPIPTQYVENREFGYRRIHVAHAEETGGSRVNTFSMEVEYIGWPLPCIRRVQMWWPWNDPQWATSQEPDPKRQIHWTGALGNPALLGVGVWIVFILPFELFRINRRR